MSYGNYPDLASVKKILVVKLRHHGDVLLSSPVFTNLKKTLPQAQIDAFIYQDTLPMLQGHPAISDFFLYDRRWKKLSFLGKIRKELSLFRQIRKNKYDLVLNLTEGDRGALAALFSGAKIRVGIDPEKSGFLGKKSIYTHLVKNCKTPRHTVEKNLDALRKIGIFPKEDERDLTFAISDKELTHITTLLQEKTVTAQNYILIHPVSRWGFKCCPPALIAGLIKQLHAHNKTIILTAGPDPLEMSMLEDIIKLSPPESVINLGGQVSLKGLGALIQLSECVICVDSVPLHIASALKTPLVVLFGPSCERNWGPWMHPRSRVVSKTMSCRPCYMDGCGGSKMSDCLHSLPLKNILSAISELHPKY
jgi:heptosyltransferase-3